MPTRPGGHCTLRDRDRSGIASVTLSLGYPKPHDHHRAAHLKPLTAGCLKPRRCLITSAHQSPPVCVTSSPPVMAETDKVVNLVPA